MDLKFKTSQLCTGSVLQMSNQIATQSTLKRAGQFFAFQSANNRPIPQSLSLSIVPTRVWSWSYPCNLGTLCYHGSGSIPYHLP